MKKKSIAFRIAVLIMAGVLILGFMILPFIR